MSKEACLRQLASMTYANGTSVEYVYDEYDVPITCNYAFFDDGGTWYEVKAEYNEAYQLLLPQQQIL